MKIDPLKKKYWPLYWGMAELAASQSVATRHQVGAVVVTPTGMVSVGWNGMPPGLTNECENEWVTEIDENGKTYQRRKTDPRVIHAERNALDKMTNQGVPTEGSLLFVTRSPCFECSKAIHGLGLKAIVVDEAHDEASGLKLLRDTGNNVIWRHAPN